MLRRALILFALALAPVACAQLLGGLEEGTLREGPGDAAVEAALDVAPPCRALDGYAYRVPIRIEHEGPAIDGYQVKLVFSSREIVGSGRMRADGADLAVTLVDGITRVPHWVQSGVGTDTTTLWTRFDLGAGPVNGWLYYGNEAAMDSSSAPETFVSAVIANPSFDRDEAWLPFRENVGPSTSSNQWSVRVGDGGADVYLATSPTPNGITVGVCQPVHTPPGDYRLLFDFELRLAQIGTALIAVSPERIPIWDSRAANFVAPTSASNVETAAFTGQRVPICLLARTSGTVDAPGVSATFRRLRLRRWLEGDRVAVIAGSESMSCAR